MKIRNVVGLAAALLAGAACEGPRGPEGARPDSLESPRIVTVAPESGSARSVVTIRGSGFDEAAEVWFDGTRAEVLSAGAEELVVRPVGAVVAEPRAMQLTVIAGRQASNGVSWRALPSGFVEPMAPRMLRAAGPIAVSADGTAAWAGDELGGIVQFDPATGAQTALRLNGEIPPGISTLAYDEERGALFATWPLDAPADEPRWTVARIELSTGVIERFDTIFREPQHAVVHGDRLVVATGSELLRYHAADRRYEGAVQASWGLDRVTGMAGHGGDLYVSLRSGAIHRLADGVASLDELALDGVSAAYGLYAGEGRLRVLASDREQVIDPVALQVTDVAGSIGEQVWSEVPALRLADGAWLWADQSLGVSLRRDGTSSVSTPVIASLSLVPAERGLLAVASSCGLGTRAAHGVWAITEDGLEPVLPEVCALSLEALPDGRVLYRDLLEQPSQNDPDGSARVVAYDPASGELEVLLYEASWGLGVVVGPDAVYLANADETIDRLPLDGGAVQRGWGTSLAAATGGVALDDRLLLHTSNGFETVALPGGGAASSVLETSDSLSNLGQLVRDGEGRLLLSTGYSVATFADDRVTPIHAIAEGGDTERLIYAIVPMPDGGLVLGGPGRLSRLVP